MVARQFHRGRQTEQTNQFLGRLTHRKNRAGDITSSLAWDDLTGMRLEAGRVVEARAKEVTYLREKRVYDKIHRQYAMRNKWKVIRTRWIDINKGDDDNPVYRSRLVGKEFNDGQIDGLFAGTPPHRGAEVLSP